MIGELRLDHVMNLEYFGLAGVDTDLGQDRPQLLTERVEVLLRIPDLADFEIAVRAKAELVIEALRGKDTRIRQPTDNFVVLRRRQRRRRKTDKETQANPSIARGGPPASRPYSDAHQVGESPTHRSRRRDRSRAGGPESSPYAGGEGNGGGDRRPRPR